MEWILPWLVRWACRAGTRDFCPALAALVGPVQNMFFPLHNIAQQPGSGQAACLCICVSGGNREDERITERKTK